MPVRCCGIIEIPSIGDLLTKIALEPMRVEDAYEIVHTVLSIAPNQMAIWVAINEAHVPYGTIAKLGKPLFKALAGDSHSGSVHHWSKVRAGYLVKHAPGVRECNHQVALFRPQALHAEGHAVLAGIVRKNRQVLGRALLSLLAVLVPIAPTGVDGQYGAPSTSASSMPCLK